MGRGNWSFESCGLCALGLEKTPSEKMCVICDSSFFFCVCVFGFIEVERRNGSLNRVVYEV